MRWKAIWLLGDHEPNKHLHKLFKRLVWANNREFVLYDETPLGVSLGPIIEIITCRRYMEPMFVENIVVGNERLHKISKCSYLSRIFNFWKENTNWPLRPSFQSSIRKCWRCDGGADASMGHEQSFPRATAACRAEHERRPSRVHHGFKFSIRWTFSRLSRGKHR